MKFNLLDSNVVMVYALIILVITTGLLYERRDDQWVLGHQMPTIVAWGFVISGWALWFIVLYNIWFMP